jgi:hypothetical protein
MIGWWWIAGTVAFFALALTGILDVLLEPLLRRLLGDATYETTDETAREFRETWEAEAEAKADRNVAFLTALKDLAKETLSLDDDPPDPPR